MMPYNRSSHLKRVAKLNGWYVYSIPDPELGEPYIKWIECDASHPGARPDLNKAHACVAGVINGKTKGAAE